MLNNVSGEDLDEQGDTSLMVIYNGILHYVELELFASNDTVYTGMSSELGYPTIICNYECFSDLKKEGRFIEPTVLCYYLLTGSTK